MRRWTALLVIFNRRKAHDAQGAAFRRFVWRQLTTTAITLMDKYSSTVALLLRLIFIRLYPDCAPIGTGATGAIFVGPMRAAGQGVTGC
jgi:hypothetical protein